MPSARRSASALAALAVAGIGQAAADTTAITVYPDGAAVVSESRQVPLEAGTQTVRLTGLPDRLRPETLWLNGEGVSLVASSYRDGASGRSSLLRALEGKTVPVLRGDGSGGDVSREATLLSADGVPVVRIGDRVEWIDGASPWRIALEGVPEAANLAGRLALTLNADSAGRANLDLTYQMDGLSWSAAYVARLDEADSRLSLRGQAALSNDTGAAWDGAEMALIAGEVSRTSKSVRPAMMRAESTAAADAGVSAEQAFEYYRYRLPEPVTLARGEQRNVTLFPAEEIAVEREYRIEGGWRRAGDAERANAAIRVAFENELGKPLPGGVVRVYGDAGPPMLLGEARIPNTPEGGDVSMTLGQAFDVTAERVTTDSERDGKAREIARRITLENAKDRAVEVRVVESVSGDWEMVSESEAHERLDANRVSWTLSVPAEGSAELTYRVRYR